MVFELSLTFSSKTARQENFSYTPSNFATKFRPSLNLDKTKKYKVALHSLQSVYSWHNIEATRNNNLVRYSTDGVVFKDVNFADGVYSYSDINKVIHQTMEDNGDYTEVNGEKIFAINLSFNINTFNVELDITPPYQFDMVSQNFGDLLGFLVDLPYTGYAVSDKTPDITNSIDNIFVKCSLVSDSINDGSSGDTLFTYSTATLSRSFSYQFEPYNLLWSNLNSYLISEVRFRTTDVFNRDIDFNGVDVQYTIIIKEIE
jgi:hypothetical protein